MKSHLLYLLFLTNLTSFSQVAVGRLNTIGGKLCFKGGDIKTLELGITPMWRLGYAHSIAGYFGPYLSGGVSLNQKQTIFVPKIGFDYHLAFFGARLSCINYTNFNGNQFCVLPEIGLSFLGYFSILYGFNIDLSEAKHFTNDTHTISATLTLPLHN